LIHTLWPDFTAAGAYLPFLSETLSTWTHFVEKTIMLLLIFTAVDCIMYGSKKYTWLGVFFIMLMSIVSVDIHDFFPLWLWALVGICSGIVILIIFVYGIRFSRASIPILVAVIGAFKIAQQTVFNAYPGALIGGIAAVILMVSFAIFWSYQLAYGKGTVRLMKP
jgi:hypothetical protein